MAKITPGNHLYFYQLFSEQLGVGKQTSLQRVEEVLAEADVLLDDVECESVDQLVEALADFLKLTVFKKGRVFVTVMQSDELDALLEKAAQPVVDKAAAAAGKSWKRARRSKDVRPTKPRHKRKPVAAQPEPAAEEAVAEPVAEPEVVPVPDAVAEAEDVEAVEPEVVPTHTEATEVEGAPEAQPEPEPEPDSTPEPAVNTTPEAEPKPKIETVPEAEPEPEATPESAPAPEPEQELEPRADIAPEPDPETVPEPEPETTPAPEPTARNPKRIHTTPKLRRVGLPQSISEDVRCPNELLLKLYQLLPDTIGIMDALDEGWEYAQQAGTIEGTRSQMTFPLSRSNRPGYPIEVTIRRSARIPSGQAWLLTQVERPEDDAEDEAEPPEAVSGNPAASVEQPSPDIES